MKSSNQVVQWPQQFIKSDDLTDTHYVTCKEIFARPVVTYSEEIQRLNHIQQNDSFVQYLQEMGGQLKSQAIQDLNSIETDEIITDMVKCSLINGLIDCKEKLERFMPSIYESYVNNELVKSKLDKIFTILQINILNK